MFERRLRYLVLAMTVLAVVIVGRLVEIQVVRAGYYESLEDRLLTRPIRYLPAPRGSILDRTGRALVSDEPTSDLCVHYAIVSGDDEDYLRATARRLRKSDPELAGLSLDQIVQELRIRVAESWTRIAELTGVGVDQLLARAEAIRRRVERIREEVFRRTGIHQPVAEERAVHPLVRALDDEAALRARLELEPRYPWISVVPGSKRTAHDADAAVHLLGRVGAATAERIRSDPLADDPRRRLRPGDVCGISGIERLAETTLRGVRGLMRLDFDRRTVLEHEPARRGGDVRLTIDAWLQQTAYDVLARYVEQLEYPAGAAAVVLDARTREVLALVSYPGYRYDEYRTRYAELRDDLRRMPLRFRAVAEAYPPGSTCKLISLYAALAERVLTPETIIVCRGIFRENLPNAFRCWIYNMYHTTHGPQIAEDAIRNSCNIYFYAAGDKLGAARLCRWFRRFGLGRTQGTGLIEETRGIVPDEAWLRAHRGRGFRPADAWNFAIGQGEVAATPIQVANAVATVATGAWMPVRLLLDPPPQRPAELVTFDQQWLDVLRTGMWRVVNEPGGTGHRGKLRNRDYVLCGKTGSAQAVPRVLSREYTLEFPDGHRETVVARSKAEALARFDDPPPRIVGWRARERWPPWQPGDKLPAHAWFIGYTQRRETKIGARPTGRVYAIAVLIEYGGSGGQVAAPAARDIIDALLEREAR